MGVKLLILEDATEMGGVQHSTLNFLKGLRGDDEFEAVVLLPGEGPFSEACRIEGLSFECYLKLPFFRSSLSLFYDKIRIPNVIGLTRNLFRNHKQLKILIPLIKKYKPDIILTKGMGAHFNGGRACKKLNIPCVWHQQDFISERYMGAYRMIFNYLASRYATYLIADGTPIKWQLTKSLQKNCEIVFNGVDLGSFYTPEERINVRKELRIPNDAYVIGHIARLTPWKGQHLLLEAFMNYRKKKLNAHLLLVGSPLFNGESYEKYLKATVKENNLQKYVHLPGYRSDLGGVLSAIDTFIYPSVEKDTSPLSLISAMAAGLSLGVSNIDGLSEMVTGCEGVLLFENRNIAEMEKIIEYFESNLNRSKASIVNKDWAYKHFSLEAYTSHLKNILKSNV